jgi:hypothetical protein
MIFITNGINEFEVSRGAYESIFQKQGYSIVVDTETEVVENNKDAAAAEPAKQVDKDAEALMEKPISQWTKNEVKSFIDKKKIDVSGITSFNEVKDRVRKYIEEEM